MNKTLLLLSSIHQGVLLIESFNTLICSSHKLQNTCTLSHMGHFYDTFMVLLLLKIKGPILFYFI